uniref:C2H2-type domain-containing protein n=1 Tax=Callorhinchus milii TaxID=7868 RepID=A0A4W3JGJ3_CALMI
MIDLNLFCFSLSPSPTQIVSTRESCSLWIKVKRAFHPRPCLMKSLAPTLIAECLNAQRRKTEWWPPPSQWRVWNTDPSQRPQTDTYFVCFLMFCPGFTTPTPCRVSASDACTDACTSFTGKVFKCSTNDCTEAFASMQHLMNHMRAHYKPNRYFKCETCKLSFRSHRSLFKHLHVCPNLATNALSLKAEKPWSPGRPASSEPDPLLKTPVPVEPVIFQSVIKQLEKEGSADTVSPAASSKPASALPSPLPSLHTSLGSMPLVSTGPHPFSLLQPSLFAAPGLGRFPGQAHAQVPGPFIPYMHPGPYSLPQAGLQPRLRPYVPSQSLPFSNAVWRKSAGER